MDVADGPGILKALRRAKRLGGIARDITVPRLPNALIAPFIHDIWPEHANDCAQPSFARLHRQAIHGLRGPALRLQPSVRSMISHLLEYGHVPKRVEHWATSGAGRRLVYRYPLLDRRLVEFTLGVPAVQFCRVSNRLPIFRRSVTPLLPTSCDWNHRKSESITVSALKAVQFRAFGDWARRLIAEGGGSAPGRFVDAQTILKIVQVRGKSERMAALAGVREAFECYALGKYHESG
jgi:asparagine synthase (glutamine-hydrolysing)